MNSFRYGTCLLLLFCIFSLSAQQTGKITFDQLGIAFTIPTGWVGQEGDGMYLLGSNSVPGLVLLLPQDYPDLNTLKRELQAGYADQMGSNLQLSGGLEALDATAYGGVYQGYLEGAPARGYVIGVLNPKGAEVIILAITTTQAYSQAQVQAAKAVRNSLEFFAPNVAAAPAAPGNSAGSPAEWTQLLGGTKLTYMESYSSSSYTDGGISGGYSIEKTFDLCVEGYFKHSGSDNMSLGGDYSSGYSSSNSRGSGQWKVVSNAQGQAILRFEFYNGTVWEYVLSMQDKKLFLNNHRYYRTWTGDYAPNCP